MTSGERPTVLLDRIVGLVSAAAVLLGLACQIAWLTGAVEPQLRDNATTAFFLVAIIPLVYMVAYAGRRDRLPYDIDGSLELRPIFRALPGWARKIAIGLFVVALALMAVALVPALPGLSAASCKAGDCLSWPNLIAAMIATFTALAFVDAAYLLRTMRAQR